MLPSRALQRERIDLGPRAEGQAFVATVLPVDGTGRMKQAVTTGLRRVVSVVGGGRSHEILCILRRD